MITHTKASRLVLGLLALTPLLAITPAHAVNTAANTTIGNSATVTYQVGGQNQPSVCSSPTGNTTSTCTLTTFVVDNKIDLTLVEANGVPAKTQPGLNTAGIANDVASFKLTNTGNNAQGYSFVVDYARTGALFGNTDTFDMTAAATPAVVSAAPCSNTAPVSSPPTAYNSATDTATSVLTLAPDSCVYVLVLGNTPNSLANGAAAIVRLTATTTTAGTTTPVVETTTADTTGVDIVFADSATGPIAQIARDAKAFADDEYLIQAPALTVTKTSAVISDPFNLAVNPKAIPGATIEYTITAVNNGTGTAATSVIISDVIPANTTFVSGSILLNGGAITDAVGYTAGTKTVAVTVASLASAATATVKFRVTIN